jgi:hypothetical protein
MVLSTLPLLLLIPIAFAIKSPRMAIHGLGATAIAALIYLLLNPYVWIDFFWHRGRLVSNLSNSAAMYHLSIISALGSALRLTVDGTSPIIFIFGIIGGVVLLMIGRKRLWLLIAAGALEWAPFAVFAAGKPAEYGRFALLPDVTLMLLAISFLGEFPRTIRLWLMLALLIIPAFTALSYWRGYLADAQPDTTRMQLAADLKRWAGGKNLSIALTAEPAPYCAPPMDLFDWKLTLLPRGPKIVPSNLPYDFLISAVDTPPTPMSWANKQFKVYRGLKK